MYVGVDAALNPANSGRHLEAFKEGTNCLYVGSNTTCFEPYFPVTSARYAGAAAGTS